MSWSPFTKWCIWVSERNSGFSTVSSYYEQHQDSICGPPAPPQCFPHHMSPHQTSLHLGPPTCTGLRYQRFISIVRWRVPRHREFSKKHLAHGHLTSDNFLIENRDTAQTWQPGSWGTCFPGILGQPWWPDASVFVPKPFTFAHSWLQKSMWPILAL